MEVVLDNADRLAGLKPVSTSRAQFVEMGVHRQQPTRKPSPTIQFLCGSYHSRDQSWSQGSMFSLFPATLFRTFGVVVCSPRPNATGSNYVNLLIKFVHCLFVVCLFVCLFVCLLACSLACSLACLFV